MTRRELKTAIKKLRQERNHLIKQNYFGKSAEIAAYQLSDIDYKIESLTGQLEFQNRILPYKIATYAFIVLLASLFVWILL
jgi:hypothetical protein